MTSFTKAPTAVLDYAWDWTTWLAGAETISTFTVTAATGLTVATSPAPSQAAGVVTAWLAGGTAGTFYEVTCHVVTSSGRADDRSIQIFVQAR